MDRKFLLGLVLIAFLGLVFFAYNYLPVDVDWSRNGPASVGVDWKGAFRPASLDLLRGENPYSRGFFNPPWILLPLIPVALFPSALGASVIFALNLVAYLFTARKLGLKLLPILVFVLFSGMLVVSMNGNIEGLLSLGFLLPPEFGLLLVLAKPQFGIGVAIFWIVQAFRNGGIKSAILISLPVMVAYLLSFLLFGLWPFRSIVLDTAWWNASIFPYGIPVGLALLALSIYKNKIGFAIASSPFFAPYLTGHTWAVVWLGLLLVVSELDYKCLVENMINSIRWIGRVRA